MLPKNILMIGPTGVGKTEIARRLAKLANAPFLKVEATKFTEVGYVGRDVEQIIRDLVEVAIVQMRERKRKDVQARAQQAGELQPPPAVAQRDGDRSLGVALADDEAVEFGNDFTGRKVGHGS